MLASRSPDTDNAPQPGPEPHRDRDGAAGSEVGAFDALGLSVGASTLIRLPRPSASSARTIRWRRTVVPSSGAGPALRRTADIRLSPNFSRPLRRSGARSLTEPGHMAPRGAVALSRRARHLIGPFVVDAGSCSSRPSARSGSRGQSCPRATKQVRMPAGKTASPYRAEQGVCDRRRNARVGANAGLSPAGSAPLKAASAACAPPPEL